MKTPILQAHKLKRVVDTIGVDYSFKRNILDSYKEPTGEKTEITILKGILHSTANYSSKFSSDSSILHSKQAPQILTNDLSAKKLCIDDEVDIGEKVYKVSGVTDIDCLGLAFDISLEAII